jgi:hypothetical protein
MFFFSLALRLAIYGNLKELLAIEPTHLTTHTFSSRLTQHCKNAEKSACRPN